MLALTIDAIEKPMERLVSGKIVLVKYWHWLMSNCCATENPRLMFNIRNVNNKSVQGFLNGLKILCNLNVYSLMLFSNVSIKKRVSLKAPCLLC